jgi:D-xylose transport system ATP-binding protein
MDEPCAALAGGIAHGARHDPTPEVGRHRHFLISHDMGDVFEVCDRVTVMKNGAVVDTVNVAETTQDDIVAMIIRGEKRAA